MLGDIHMKRPNWVTTEDMERTNKTSELIRSQVSTSTAPSASTPSGRTESRPARSRETVGGALAGAGIGAVPGALIGGTIGGNSASGSAAMCRSHSPPSRGCPQWSSSRPQSPAPLPVQRSAARSPPSPVRSPEAQPVSPAGTAFGAGDDEGQPIEVDLPSIDEAAITEQTDTTLTQWEESGPVGQAAATAVRDVVEADPGIDQQARDWATAQPGGQQVVDAIDGALAQFGRGSAGVAAQLVSGGCRGAGVTQA